MRHLLILTLLFASAPALSETLAPVITLQRSVEGQAISLPISIRTEPTAQREIMVDLSDALSKLDAVINAAWRQHGLDFGGRLDHRGTNWVIEGPSLQFRVHFRARPPVVPNSNGSIVLLATPAVTNGSIRLAATASDLRISNDITRRAVRVWALDRTIPNRLNASLSALLMADEAKVEMPASIAFIMGEPKSARFTLVEGRPMLQIALGSK